MKEILDEAWTDLRLNIEGNIINDVSKFKRSLDLLYGLSSFYKEIESIYKLLPPPDLKDKGSAAANVISAMNTYLEKIRSDVLVARKVINASLVKIVIWTELLG